MSAGMIGGLRVLEWADGLSAPFCGRLLSDLGAEVIKIETPDGGDTARQLGPFPPDAPHADGGALFGYLNYGKRSITLDPARASGGELLARLAASSDVLIEAQPSGVLDLCSLPVSKLQNANPALTVISITALGHSGAFSRYRSSELTLQHLAGFAYHQAMPVADPSSQPPIGGADHEGALATGVAAATAVLWSVLMAQSGGAAAHIDMANGDFLAHLLVDQVAAWSQGERAFSRQRQPGGGLEIIGGLVWMLECSDGWVMISPREQHQWSRWVELMGQPDWSRDAALCGDRAARKENGVMLQRVMSEWTRTRTRKEVFERAQAARVACFPVSTPADLLENAQLLHRKFFKQLALGQGSIPVPGLPFRVVDENVDVIDRGGVVHAPALGEANEEIFRRRLAVSADALAALRRERIV